MWMPAVSPHFDDEESGPHRSLSLKVETVRLVEQMVEPDRHTETIERLQDLPTALR
jgi:hypothetical protein